MTTTFDWQGQAGESWATEWKRTDRSFGGLTDHLLARSREFPFCHALDIGCGAGELSLALARGHPHSRVVGVDISPQLVAAATRRGANIPNVEFRNADAARWQPGDDFSPQLLISRHGVMFFDDPTAAFANLASLAEPDAALLFSCFRDRCENPFFTAIGELFPPPPVAPDPAAPGPFAFAERERVMGILTGGGWTDIAFEPFDFAMVAGAGDDPIEEAMAYFLKIGPAAAVLRELDDDARDQALARMREVVRENCRDGIVAMLAAVWIVTARRA